VPTTPPDAPVAPPESRRRWRLGRSRRSRAHDAVARADLTAGPRTTPSAAPVVSPAILATPAAVPASPPRGRRRRMARPPRHRGAGDAGRCASRTAAAPVSPAGRRESSAGARTSPARSRDSPPRRLALRHDAWRSGTNAHRPSERARASGEDVCESARQLTRPSDGPDAPCICAKPWGTCWSLPHFCARWLIVCPSFHRAARCACAIAHSAVRGTRTSFGLLSAPRSAGRRRNSAGQSFVPDPRPLRSPK